MPNETELQDLAAIQQTLTGLLKGSVEDGLQVVSGDPEITGIATSIHTLTAQLREIQTVVTELADGRLDGAIPGRRNYLAAPLKSLQSRLAVLVWNARQLLADKVVSNIEYEGELYETINQLMRTITRQKMSRHSDGEGDESLSSWKYHQILLALNKLQLLVLEVDASGEIVYANEMAASFFGSIRSLSAPHNEEEIDELADYLGELMQDRSYSRHQEELYDRRREAWFSVTMEEIIFPNDEVFYMFMVDDITAWKNKTIMLERKASFDLMTGAYNKRGGMETLRRVLESVDLDSVHTIAFVDLDGLKTINDEYGHREGDFFIKSMANVLIRSVRQTDMVIRYGGDEFVIFLLKCQLENGKKNMEAARKRLEEFVQKAGKPYPMGFSYGLAEFRSHSGGDVLASIEAADKEMYRDKRRRHAARK